jgi:pantothenate kinase
MIKVNSKDDFQRVSGTMIGGGTLIGLSNLLLKVNSFEKIQEICTTGDNSSVDTLIKDLYGHKYEGFEPDTIATSFGKIASLSADELVHKKFKDADVAMSLIAMITFNISQIAYL